MYSGQCTFKRPTNQIGRQPHKEPAVDQIRRPLRWVSPFGNLRIKGCSRLPEAYRSVPRPSSPLDAKASIRSPYALDRSQQNSCWTAPDQARARPNRPHALCICQTMMSSQGPPSNAPKGAPDKPFNSQCHKALLLKTSRMDRPPIPAGLGPGPTIRPAVRRT